MSLRLVFMGTPGFSVPTLMALHAAGHAIAGVYTQPPRPAGRSLAARPSPVQLAAEQLGLPVHCPASLRDAKAQAELAALHADAAVVIAYGLILPRTVLEAPRQGCYNLHASLLPRWRGAAPIHRAVLAGDKETGVMLMRMTEGLDTGPVCLTERTTIGSEETTGDLHERLAKLAANVSVRGLALLEKGEIACVPQSDDGVLYAAKINKNEGRIDWRQPAIATHDLIRGLAPFPGAWCELRLPDSAGPERVKLLRSRIVEGGGPASVILSANPLRIACGDGAIEVVEAQRAGKRAVSGAEFARGTRLAAGLSLG